MLYHTITFYSGRNFYFILYRNSSCWIVWQQSNNNWNLQFYDHVSLKNKIIQLEESNALFCFFDQWAILLITCNIFHISIWYLPIHVLLSPSSYTCHWMELKSYRRFQISRNLPEGLNTCRFSIKENGWWHSNVLRSSYLADPTGSGPWLYVPSIVNTPEVQGVQADM